MLPYAVPLYVQGLASPGDRSWLLTCRPACTTRTSARTPHARECARIYACTHLPCNCTCMHIATAQVRMQAQGTLLGRHACLTRQFADSCVDRAIIPPASGLGCNVSQETEDPEDRHLGVTLVFNAREQSIEGERSKESVGGSIRQGSRELGQRKQTGEKKERHGGEAATERIPGYVSSPFMRPPV